MYLCINVLNHKIECGLFQSGRLLHSFESGLSHHTTADEYGIWIEQVCSHYKIMLNDIQQVGFCSVVPQINSTLKKMCKHYFNKEPFALKPGVKTGLKINYKNPIELGSDRIARAVAATHQFPNQNIIIVSLDRINTICAVSNENNLLGGAIFPGMEMGLDSLSKGAERIQAIELTSLPGIIAQTTQDAIQTGLYYSQVGAIERFIQEIEKQYFNNQTVIKLVSGEFYEHFEQENLFDVAIPNLSLQGLHLLISKNLT